MTDDPRGFSASPEKLLPDGDSIPEWPTGVNWGMARKRACSMCGDLGMAAKYRDSEREWWLCHIHAWVVEGWRAK